MTDILRLPGWEATSIDETDDHQAIENAVNAEAARVFIEAVMSC